MVLYALRDRVIGRIIPETVTAAHNDEHMRRMLRDTVQGNHPVARHPEDFELVKIGELDELGAGFPFLSNMRDVLRGVDAPLSEER